MASYKWQMTDSKQLGSIFICLLLSLFLLAFSNLARAQDNLSAFVDRTDVSVNEVITLTIRVGSILGNQRPSLDPLNNDFDLLGTTTSNSYSNINGSVQSWTEYRVSLKPKTSGTLSIPSFQINNERTQAIIINVSEASQLNGSTNNDIFLDTSVNKDTVYVQEQLIYTIKLYYSLRFDQGAQLSTPQVGDAVIQQLGNDVNYQEIVDGIRYDVTERRFVIFPQSSGELEIPPIYFTATVGGRNGLSRLLNRSSPMRQIDLASESHEITVKGIPASFSGQTWLPASQLELNEEWSGDMNSLEVGDALTRNITLRAHGLSSSLLPDLDYQQVNGLKVYPDQPSDSDSADQAGVIGTREEGMAIVPSTAGSFTIPELTVPWWNTETDREEVARIPAHTLSVSAGQFSQGVPSIPDNPPVSNTNIPQSEPVTITTRNPFNVIWIILSAVFALAWLFSTYMWLQQRRLLLSHTHASGATALSGIEQTDKAGKQPDLRTAFKAFSNACSQESLTDIRHSVLQWGQAFYNNPNILTLDQLRAYTGNPTVNALLFNLEQALYRPASATESSTGESFRSQQLHKEIAALHKAGPASREKMADNNQLPPLYKN